MFLESIIFRGINEYQRHVEKLRRMSNMASLLSRATWGRGAEAPPLSASVGSLQVTVTFFSSTLTTTESVSPEIYSIIVSGIAWWMSNI